jgi:hypothetical protein
MATATARFNVASLGEWPSCPSVRRGATFSGCPCHICRRTGFGFCPSQTIFRPQSGGGRLADHPSVQGHQPGPGGAFARVVFAVPLAGRAAPPLDVRVSAWVLIRANFCGHHLHGSSARQQNRARHGVWCCLSAPAVPLTRHCWGRSAATSPSPGAQDWQAVFMAYSSDDSQ